MKLEEKELEINELKQQTNSLQLLYNEMNTLVQSIKSDVVYLLGRFTRTTGDLQVTSDLPGQTVRIFKCNNDTCTSRTSISNGITPFTQNNLAPGKYLVYYYRNGKYKDSKYVTVISNQLVTVNFNF